MKQAAKHPPVNGWLKTGITVWMKLDDKGDPIPGTIWPHDYAPENIDDYFEVEIV